MQNPPSVGVSAADTDVPVLVAPDVIAEFVMVLLASGELNCLARGRIPHDTLPAFIDELNRFQRTLLRAAP